MLVLRLLLIIVSDRGTAVENDGFHRMNIDGSKDIRRFAEAIVESGQLGKSELYQKLFLYLVDASLKGNAPKEIDIALDVFGKDESFNVHEDSIVRVYIHSLRGKLDEYYRHAGGNDDIRIQIPKGGYRVVAVRNDRDGDDVGKADSPVAAERVGSRRSWMFAATAAMLAVAIVGDIYFATRGGSYDASQTNHVGKSFVWAGLLQDSRPVTIILGDLFFFSELDPELGRQRLIGDIPITSRDGLQAFLKNHEDRVSRLGPFDTTFLTTGAAYSLAAVMPILEGRGRKITVTILDELDVADIRDHDIIFVGPLYRLGPLAEYYNGISRYKYDHAANRIEDKVTGTGLTARGPLNRDGLDYGVFAEYRGPTDNYIMIFGSVTSDIALLQVVRNMTSPTELDRIGKGLQSDGGSLPPAFEALFAATGYERTDLSSDIVALHALNAHPAQGGAGGP
jgi:hypothetical protein